MSHVGSRVGRYTLIAPISEGSMSRVFSAKHVVEAGPVREVIVELLHRRFTGTEVAHRFLDEARARSLLRHPNVVAVEDFGEKAGLTYRVVETVRGCTLRQLVALCAGSGRPLPVAAAAYIAVQLAQGLHALHTAEDANGRRRPLVHGDIRCDNVVLTANGGVKLEAPGADTVGLAPEQRAGLEQDPRTDVHGLGCLLYRLLTGERFDPLHPMPRSRAVPNALYEVLTRALQRDPARRYPSAIEAGRAIAAAVPEVGQVCPYDLAPLVAEARRLPVERTLSIDLQRLDDDPRAAPRATIRPPPPPRKPASRRPLPPRRPALAPSERRPSSPPRPPPVPGDASDEAVTNLYIPLPFRVPSSSEEPDTGEVESPSRFTVVRRTVERALEAAGVRIEAIFEWLWPHVEPTLARLTRGRESSARASA